MGKRFAFDVRAAIPAAWAFLWANNMKNRKAWKADAYRYSSTYYLTAADVENQVREFAAATARGEPWEKAPVACGRPYHGIRINGDLQGAVRNWLLHGNGGKIVGHNFGRGHISGMRFRPAGEPISDTEKSTMEKKAARRLRPVLFHFNKHHRPLCTSNRPHSWGRSRAWMTSTLEKVTCPRCKKLLAAQPFTAKEVA